MASASASVSVIYLFTQLVQLVMAQEQGGQTCLSSFQCGTRGKFSYPFNTIFNSGCGIFILNCTEPVQTIRLGRQGPWYDIKNSFANNRTFLVDDLLLQHVSNGDDNCNIFDESFHLPRSPAIFPSSGIPGGSIVLILLAILSWRLRKMKLRLPTFGSRNISADPTRTDLGRSKMYFSLPIFSYSELEEATNNFDPATELGEGGFGTVYYGKLKDGREVAVKRLYERSYRQLEQFMNEIEILTCLRHQNLVSLYACTSRRSRELLLVYEYMPNGTVADHLYGEQAKCSMLTWPIRMSIAVETATALSYLQASGIIHRDVKSTNILLDNNFRVKVADFGLSRLFPTDVTHISTVPQGTPGYLDPEYHQCYQLTGKSDVYSFGIVLIELISSLPKTRTDADCVYLLRNNEDPPSPNSVMHKWGSSKSITPAASG